MSQFNIFMNSYQQPENKLTYIFLCLIEHIPPLKQKKFIEFLMDERFRLSAKPCFRGQGVFGGQESNPDGQLIVLREDGKALNIYLENKTFRLSLTSNQILNHVKYYCKDEVSFLLIITPRPADYTIIRECVEKVGNKIFFKTWGDVVQKLKEFILSDNDFISSQFIEYGELSGEFFDMQPDSRDIENYVGYHNRNVVNRIKYVLESASREIDYSLFDDSIRFNGINDGYGRIGCHLLFKNHYGIEFFFGVYYNNSDHKIRFKKESEPELVLFIDIDQKYKDCLKEKQQARDTFDRLQNHGFENNLFDELTSNRWRLLAHRTPLLQFGEFSIVTVANHIRRLIEIFYSEKDFVSLIKTSTTSSEHSAGPDPL